MFSVESLISSSETVVELNLLILDTSTPLFKRIARTDASIGALEKEGVPVTSTGIETGKTSGKLIVKFTDVEPGFIAFKGNWVAKVPTTDEIPVPPRFKICGLVTVAVICVFAGIEVSSVVPSCEKTLIWTLSIL